MPPALLFPLALLRASAFVVPPPKRTGGASKGRHALVGLLRQSVFGRLAGYEDVNDAERLRHDPAMRWIVGGKAVVGRAASPSQIGRFETQWLATDKNLSALADLSGQWIDLVHGRRPPRGIVFDMDSSVSPTHGEQENSVWSANVVSHGRYIVFQLAEVAIPRQMIQGILRLIAELRPQPPPALA